MKPDRVSFKLALALGLFSLGVSGAARASINLLDKDDWKIMMGGFVETDVVRDSTRGFNEVLGNNAVANANSAPNYDGDNGRLFFSNRNSRLSFTVLPPAQENLKTKAYFEMDFLGYEPNVAAGTPAVSETGFFSNPAIRIRHAFGTLDDGTWSTLIGQTWSLFGFQPLYVPTTVSVSPGPGMLYSRELQLTEMNTLNGSAGVLVSEISVARPAQRDGQMPNLNAGVKWSFGERRSALNSASGETSLEPLSIAFSGTFRQYEVPQSVNFSSGQSHANAQAGAVDVLLPIFASTDKDPGGNLVFTAEYSNGSGYADELPGWSGNLASFPSGAAGTLGTKLNLDAGQAGFDNAGNFTLVRLATFSSQLQYHFPGSKESNLFATFGYSQLSSDNVDQLQASVGHQQGDLSLGEYVLREPIQGSNEAGPPGP